MASEIRVNQIQNRSGLSTVTFSDTGVVISGITTITDLRASGNIIVAAGSTSAPSISPTGDSNTGIFFPSADTIAFAEGGAEAARINSSGRLLIGTTDDVSTTLNVRGVITSSNSLFTYSTLDGYTDGNLYITANAGQANTTNSNIIFRNSTSGGTVTEYARISSSGNLGIGTAVPSQKLEVVGGEIKAGRVDSTNEGGQVSFGRATDNATGWYIDVYGNTSTPSLRFVDVSNSAVRATIDGSGRLTLPYQPAFIASKNSGQNLTQSVNNVVVFDTEVIDIGSNYSSNRFTAPVSGTYQFQFTCMGSSSNSGYLRMSLKKNGSGFYGITYATITVSAYESIVSSSLINLSANDYVEAEIYPSMASFALDNTGTFSGYLVG